MDDLHALLDLFCHSYPLQQAIGDQNIIANHSIVNVVLHQHRHQLPMLESSEDRASHMIDALYDIGLRLYEQGVYHRALVVFATRPLLFEYLIGTHHLQTARCFHDGAYWYHCQGVYPEAQEYYEEALDIYDNLTADVTLETADVQYNLAWLYRDRGVYHQARTYYERALSTYCVLLPPHDMHRQSCHADLASLPG